MAPDSPSTLGVSRTFSFRSGCSSWRTTEGALESHRWSGWACAFPCKMPTRNRTMKTLRWEETEEYSTWVMTPRSQFHGGWRTVPPFHIISTPMPPLLLSLGLGSLRTSLTCHAASCSTMQHHAAPSSDGFKIWGPKSPSKKQGPVENPISLHSKQLVTFSWIFWAAQQPWMLCLKVMFSWQTPNCPDMSRQRLNRTCSMNQPACSACSTKASATVSNIESEGAGACHQGAPCFEKLQTCHVKVAWKDAKTC